MKRDYPELEGKVIEYVNPDFPEIKSALVVGVNHDIGITLVDAEDTSEYLVCLIGPSSPLWERAIPLHHPQRTETEEIKTYKKIFAFIIKMIKIGKWDGDKVNNFIETNSIRDGYQPSAASCSFAA